MKVKFSFLDPESSESTALTLRVQNTEVREKRKAIRAPEKNARITLL